MVAVIFDSSRSDPVRYLLGMEDAKKLARAFVPVVLAGDAREMRALIRDSRFRSKYLSGVLAFSERLEEIHGKLPDTLAQFRRWVSGGQFPGRVIDLFVLHLKADGRVEIHFLLLAHDPRSGRSLDLYSHRRDLSGLEAWTIAENKRSGYKDPRPLEHFDAFNPVNPELPESSRAWLQALDTALGEALISSCEALRNGHPPLLRSAIDVRQALSALGGLDVQSHIGSVSLRHPDHGKLTLHGAKFDARFNIRSFARALETRASIDRLPARERQAELDRRAETSVTRRGRLVQRLLRDAHPESEDLIGGDRYRRATSHPRPHAPTVALAPATDYVVDRIGDRLRRAVDVVRGWGIHGAAPQGPLGSSSGRHGLSPPGEVAASASAHTRGADRQRDAASPSFDDDDHVGDHTRRIRKSLKLKLLLAYHAHANRIAEILDRLAALARTFSAALSRAAGLARDFARGIEGRRRARADLHQATHQLERGVEEIRGARAERDATTRSLHHALGCFDAALGTLRNSLDHTEPTALASRLFPDRRQPERTSQVDPRAVSHAPADRGPASQSDQQSPMI